MPAIFEVMTELPTYYFTTSKVPAKSRVYITSRGTRLRKETEARREFARPDGETSPASINNERSINLRDVCLPDSRSEVMHNFPD